MKATTPLLSIVSPVYNAEKIVDLLVEQIITEATKITDNFEIILIEDGSSDNFCSILRLSQQHNVW